MLKEQLLDHNKTYIVGVSGGSDSMALLDLLHQGHYHVVVAHVNYNLRNDTALDYQVVHDYCVKNNIVFAYKEVSHADYQKGNFQAVAREIRYRFYKELYLKYDAAGVVLGHHFDDQVETIYMYLDRGSKSDYIGLKEKTIIKGMTIIRPLLDVKKKALRAYCHDHGIAFHDDYTNFMTEFERDRVRNTVLNHYSDTQKQALIEKARSINQVIKQKREEIAPLVSVYEKKGKMDIRRIPDDDLEAFLYAILSRRLPAKEISGGLIAEIIHQIHAGKPNISLALPIHYLFIKEYNNIYVQKAHGRISYEYHLDRAHELYTPYFYVSSTGPLNNGVPLSDDDFPLTIRNRRPGDFIETKAGRKKIARLFIDAKIPREMRDRYPLVINSKGAIILVPGIAKRSEYTATNPNCFVVEWDTIGGLYMHKDCKEILFTGEQITDRCAQLGKAISEDYQDRDVLLIGILKGSVPFFAELAKHISLDVEFDFMSVSSYEGTESTGNVLVKKDIELSVKDKDILIVEDILDTGKTLHTVRNMLLEKGAHSVEIVTLLNKQERRVYPIQAKYVGFEIPNAFVIGYGMDYDEKYRNLPYIGILKEEVYS